MEDLDPTKVMLTSAATGNLPKLKEALGNGADINGLHHEGGWTAVSFAAQYDRVECL